MTQQNQAVGAALRIVDDVWTEARRAPGWGVPNLETFPSLPQVSWEEIQRRAEEGRKLALRIEALDATGLPHDLSLTLRLAEVYAQRWRQEAEWYWVAFDPVGVGHYGLFAPTSYCGGLFLGNLISGLQAMSLDHSGSLDRYLGFIEDFTRLVRQLHERTQGQVSRGIYMPQAQLAQAVSLLRASKLRALVGLRVADTRAKAEGAGPFLRELDRRLQGTVSAAFDDFIEFLSGPYGVHAPDAVGMSQYPHGLEIYSELVKVHTTLNVTPVEVHRLGLERIERIRSDMARIRAAAGFDGTDEAYRAHLNADAAWRATSEAEVTRVFRRYMDRIKPRLAQYFSSQPSAPYDAEALPDSLAGSMSFGFYDPPKAGKAGKAAGRYLYNARNLTQRGLFDVGSLNYHELVPGHHLHFALQMENASLHPLRAGAFINSFNEGWAEYAATLAGEMGMYEEPAERFGRCVMDAFLTTRLVVDTGMNAFGWSLQRARDFMREHAFLSEAEILTESVRYSCDIPAQSLAYKLGDVKFVELRSEMAARLGASFDIREFHDVILREGALPLSLVEQNVKEYTQLLLSRHEA